MVDGHIDLTRMAVMPGLLPNVRAIAAAGCMTTPVGRALAESLMAKIRIGEAIMSPLLKMALRNIERGGRAVCVLPPLAL